MRFVTFRNIIILLILFYIAVMLFLLSLMPAVAQDHDMSDPSHWYPAECCSQQDCYSLADGDVKETPDGYLIQSTGELFPFGKERESGDGKFHRCSSSGDKSMPTLIKGDRPCLFRPNAGT